MSLDNVIVKGMQVVNLPGDGENSTQHIPSDSDYCFYGVVVSYDENSGVCQVNSAFDENTTGKKIFYCKAEIPGISGAPSASQVNFGDGCLVLRSGPKTEILEVVV